MAKIKKKKAVKVKKAKAPKAKVKKQLKKKAKAIKKPIKKEKAVKKKQAVSAPAVVKKVPTPVVEIPEKKRVGIVTHFYNHIGVAVVKVEDTIKIGDEISIEGATTNFRQRVESMQINHQNIPEALRGQEIGLKVLDKVREGDIVYKV